MYVSQRIGSSGTEFHPDGKQVAKMYLPSEQPPGSHHALECT